MQQINKPTQHDLYQLPLIRRLSGRWRSLPDFIILGAQKAGTTSIYDNLVKHPDVIPADIKEVHFFDRNWQRGENWYRSHFPLTMTKPGLTGEGSPYYLFHPLAPERVKQVCPHAKLIVVLRNPVERTYSHYQHEWRKHREPLSFEEALAAEESRIAGEVERILSDPAYVGNAHQHYSYKARGRYAEQLQAWLPLFSPEQVLVLESRDLNQKFSATFRQLHQFLGLAPHELEAPRRRNVGSYKKMNEGTRADLVEYFRPYNEQLYDLLGRRFDWA